MQTFFDHFALKNVFVLTVNFSALDAFLVSYFLFNVALIQLVLAIF